MWLRSSVWVSLVSSFLFLSSVTHQSQAQPRERVLGIGGMVGKTAGATVKFFVKRDPADNGHPYLTAVVIDLSVSEDDYYLWTAHAVSSRAIPDSPLNVFLGPGAAVGSADSELFWGVSSILGVYFDKSRFEVFLQLTPRVILLPEIRGEFGSAVGLRYYL